MAQRTVATLKTDLKHFAALLDEDITTVVRRVALSLHRRIVLKTPVNTGRARASWTLNPGTPDRRVQPPDYQASPEQAAQDALAQQAKLGSLQPGQSAWISNGVEYIGALEGVDGPPHSAQAPQGMVAVSLAEEEAELNAVREALR